VKGLVLHATAQGVGDAPALSAARARSRHRRALLSAVATLAARGSAFVTLIISVPLVLHHMGSEATGVWLTLASFIALLGFADLGLGNGLINAAARASGEDDTPGLAAAISSTFFMLLGVAAAGGALFVAIYWFVPWADLVNAQSGQVRAQVAPAVAGLVVLLLIALPLRVVEKTQVGLQQGFYPSLWRGLGNLLGLGALAAAVLAGAGLRWLVWAPLLGVVLATAANWATFFRRGRRVLLPRVALVSRTVSRRLLRFGLGFLVMQIAIAVAYETDTVVIAQVLGPQSVQQYAVPMQLFIIPEQLLGLVLIPLWPAYSEALARGDRAWVAKTLRWTLGAALGVGAVAACAIALLAPTVIHLWVGSSVKPSVLLLCAAGAWLLVMSMTQPISIFLNGAGILGPQAISAVVMMVGNLGLSIYLAKAVGVSGVVWGTVIAQTAFCLAPAAFYGRRGVVASNLGRAA
jgi:O-antigen/teichoic acid export membrane protein